MSWNEVWRFLLDEHIFHTLTIIALIILLIKKYKKVKIGKDGLEVDSGNESVNPEAPCPYTASKKRSVEAIEKNSKRIDELTDFLKERMTKLDTVLKDIEDLRLDQLKILFRLSSQPKEERLIAGLKYVNMGGNHDTKEDVIEMAKENPDMYSVICALAPHLKLKEIKIK